MYYVDMDGVLCDFVGEAARRLGVSWRGESLSLQEGLGVELYDIICRWPNIFAELPMTSFGQHIINDMRQRDWHIITDDSGYLDIFAGKRAWLRANIPWMCGRMIVISGGNKRDVIGYDGVCLIDDMERHQPDILIPQPWNRHRGNDVIKIYKEGMRHNESS